jgi:hypothetical protein
MNKGLLLAGLGCALICGVVLWVLLGRSSAPAPGQGAADVPVNIRAPGDRTASSPGAPVKLDPGAVGEQAPPAAHAQPAPAGSNTAPTPARPAPKVTGFLPYPNNGESDLKSKYDGLQLEALADAMTLLQQRVNDEAQALAEERFEKGLFEERSLPPPPDGSGAAGPGPPQGMGEVRSADKMVVQPDGSLKQRTTYITQSEHPEFFARQAEYLWVFNAWQQKQKQTGGH